MIEMRVDSLKRTGQKYDSYAPAACHYFRHKLSSKSSPNPQWGCALQLTMLKLKWRTLPQILDSWVTWHLEFDRRRSWMPHNLNCWRNLTSPFIHLLFQMLSPHYRCDLALSGNACLISHSRLGPHSVQVGGLSMRRTLWWMGLWP